jgi:hypothetical protein
MVCRRFGRRLPHLVAEQLERLVFPNAVGIFLQQSLDLLVVVVPILPDGLLLGLGFCFVFNRAKPSQRVRGKGMPLITADCPFGSLATSISPVGMPG